MLLFFAYVKFKKNHKNCPTLLLLTKEVGYIDYLSIQKKEIIMKKFIILLALVIMALPLFSKSWIVSGNSNLNLSQNYYSKNWAGDEISSVTWTFTSNFTAKKQLSDIILNENSLTLSFGQTHTYDKLAEKWLKPEKSSDLIDALSLLKFTLKSLVDPFIGFRVESHFYDAKGAFQPTTLTESFGIARDFIAKKDLTLSSRLGGAFKEIFQSELDNVPVSGGIEFVTTFQKKFNIALYTSNLNVYKAMFYSESDDANDDWKSTDVNWENILAFSVSKYVAFQIYTQLLYDKEIDVKGRFKENFGLSLNYKLF